MIDSHVHLWDQSLFVYPWLKAEPGLPATVHPKDLHEAESVVREVVFVQADCLPEQGLQEARWAASLADESVEIRGVVAFAPLEDVDCAAYLDELDAIPKVVGVRRLLQDESVDFIRSADLAAGVRRLADHGWAFDACVRWQQLRALTELVQRVPEVTVVLDHLGKPPLSTPDEFDHWKQGLEELAALPNTRVKLSGLPAEAPERFVADAYRPWLLTAAELFGSHRSMVGSDWPVSARPGLTRDRWFEIVQASLAPSDDEWEALTHRTPTDVYKLGRPSPSTL